MIQFHILGAGGAVPTPTHSPAAYWVKMDNQGLLLDPGPGALVRLLKSGLQDRGVDGIETILLSHLHPDHTADLVPLLFAAHSPIGRNPNPIRLYGPSGLKALLGQLKAIYGSWLEPRNRVLEVFEWDLSDEPLGLTNGGRVRPFRTVHPQDRLSDETLGYIFHDAVGKKVVYSGDTGPCAALNEAAHRADLLVVECSTPDELAVPGHMFPRVIAELCREANPARTVLTHQYPAAAALDLATELNEQCPGEIIQAVDGDAFTVD